MKLNTLSPAEGSVQNNYRRGRGQGSGGGGTATRGHKGAQSRSGHSKKRGFEGGQMPLQRRLPKVGFNPINRTEYVGVNLDALQALAEKYNLTSIDFDTFREHGLASKNDLVKILGRGEVKSKLDVKAHAFSATAQKAIEALGGAIVKL